jgi:hypothetical protein
MKKFLKTKYTTHFIGYLNIDKIDRFRVYDNTTICAYLDGERYEISQHKDFKEAEIALNELVAWIESYEPNRWD